MAAVALMASAACGGEATSPDTRLLLGQWGSATTLLVALHSGAEVQFGCAVLIIDEPIELDDGGAFKVRGRLRSSGVVLGSLPEIRGSGQMNGSHVTLSLPVAEDVIDTYQLEAGVRPDPADAPQCPL